LLLRLNLGGCLHALELALVDHNGFALLPLLGLLSDFSELLFGKRDRSGGCGLLGVT